jgi:hypothetical protein
MSPSAINGHGDWDQPAPTMAARMTVTVTGKLHQGDFGNGLTMPMRAHLSEVQ